MDRGHGRRFTFGAFRAHRGHRTRRTPHSDCGARTRVHLSRQHTHQVFQAALVAALLTLTPHASAARQTVHGTVVEAVASRPIPAATVELVDSTQKVVGRAVGDDSGRFIVSVRDSGSFQLLARRIGFRTVRSDVLALAPGEDLTVSVRLEALPVALEPVAVTGTNPYLLQSGFYGRKSGGVGRFLDPKAVTMYAAKVKTGADILRHVPGVRLVTNSRGYLIPQMRGCLGPTGAPAYVDGTLATGDVLAMLMPGDLLAVEVYMGPAEIPQQYSTSSRCGVILIWTRH